MIFIRESSEFIDSFESLLIKVSVKIEAEFSVIKNPKDVSGTLFEKIICDRLNQLSVETTFENKFEQTTAFAFPDIIAKVLENNWFGIEVKTSKDSWKCFGNSIFESTKVENLENRIYLFFGKISENLTCKWGKYENCIESINITHSPRYQINMDILEKPQLSIFSKMQTSYLNFSEMPTSSKMTYVRAFKRKELGSSAALWWLPTNNDIDENEQRLVIRLLSELSIKERDNIRVLSLSYFPIIFSPDKNKYKALTKWIVANFGVIPSALRDTFSSKGKHLTRFNGKEIRVPRIYGHVEENHFQIKEIIRSTPLEELADFWGVELNENDEKINHWINLVSEYSGENSIEIKNWLITLFNSTTLMSR